jgi:predicted RNase H-like HicB family nuclease
MEDIPPHSPLLEKDCIWFLATCPEFPAANGQGKTKTKAKESLAHAIEVLEEDRISDEFCK